MTSIKSIEGIAEGYAKKLAEAGIRSTEKLLSMGATAAGRKDIAEQTGMSADKLLTWVNHADLFRIKGIASQYSELLEAAGVDTVVELAKRVPANLHKALLAANEAGAARLVRQVPALKLVESWVEQAKSLGRLVSH
jgi:predicted flap endonuclease-1-like 5' DNA nuclease